MESFIMEYTLKRNPPENPPKMTVIWEAEQL